MDVIPTDRTPRQSAARDFYLAYLNSSSWRARRNRALQEAKFRCQRCDAKRDLEVHHLTYERLGAELDSDLEVVCFTCHKGEHRAAAEGMPLGVYLKLVSETLRHDPWRTFADISDEVKRQCLALKIPTDPVLVSKAISLVCGSRLEVVEGGRRVPYVSVVEVKDDRPWSHAESVEWLHRTGFLGAIKSMPEVEKGAAEQSQHEANLKIQIADSWRNDKPKRRPVRERLEEIFAGRQ